MSAFSLKARAQNQSLSDGREVSMREISDLRLSVLSVSKFALICATDQGSVAIPVGRFAPLGPANQHRQLSLGPPSIPGLTEQIIVCSGTHWRRAPGRFVSTGRDQYRQFSSNSGEFSDRLDSPAGQTAWLSSSGLSWKPPRVAAGWAAGGAQTGQETGT